WGIGDFGDLKSMLAEVGERGGAFIGLNPIHALYPANPESASPYSPSSRRWLNVIYIDVNALDDFKNSAEAQAWWALDTTQQALRQAREAEWVDYATVTALKMAALRMAWKGFSQRDDADMLAFRQFIAAEGESLYWQAAFDALHAQQVKDDEMRWGWPVWPEAYQSVDSPQVRAFCEQHADEVEFYLWLQWLAYTQFAACWQVSQGYNMPIGLYR
ncbi:4-alpha-glucanotransferase, partial [Escherichia coli]|nr:4-alpha-glucanotransferase [Escherichia coli]